MWPLMGKKKQEKIYKAEPYQAKKINCTAYNCYMIALVEYKVETQKQMS